MPERELLMRVACFKKVFKNQLDVEINPMGQIEVNKTSIQATLMSHVCQCNDGCSIGLVAREVRKITKPSK